MDGLVIITSGAYVGAELAAEVGLLPPAFLPLANRRLFAHQAALFAGRAVRLVLSLPMGFELPPGDAAQLDQLHIERVYVPLALTLGDSILHVLNRLGYAAGAVRVLHGDTLFGEIPTATDTVTINHTHTFYPWAEFDAAAPAPFREGLVRRKHLPVLSGFFAFSDAGLLMQSLARARGELMLALNDYHHTTPLHPQQGKGWFDFGHVQTYYHSRSHFMASRDFNQLSTTGIGTTGLVLYKHSSKPEKLQAEAAWLEALPRPLRRFVPALLNTPSPDKAYSYALEFLRLPTLSDLYCFGRLPPLVWESIFNACDAWLLACRDYPAPPAMLEATQKLYLPKTIARLQAFAAASGFAITRPLYYHGTPVPSLLAIAEEAASHIPPPQAKDLFLQHGDFCFSNILYDHRSEAVKLIDPRGGGGGDPRYEIAKLHHSVIGCYDHLVAGRYRLAMPAPDSFSLHFADLVETESLHPDAVSLHAIQKIFQQRVFAGQITGGSLSIHAISVLLFLAMLPLHAEDATRQRAFIANALRLYQAMQPLRQSQEQAA